MDIELQQLKSPNKEVALQAIQSIGRRAEDALPILKETIQTSKDEDLVTMAIIVLGEMGNKASTAILDIIPKLEDSNEQTRMAVALSLIRIGRASIVYLREFISNNTNRNALLWASWALTMIDPKEVDESALSILVDHESITTNIIEKSAAQEALAKLIGRELTD